MDKDFREGDKVFCCIDNKYSTFLVTEITESGSIYVPLLGYAINPKFIFHDPNRRIAAAVQKAIEDNEEKPKRMVKKWVNIYINNHGRRCLIHDTEIEAVEGFKESEYTHIAIAQGIEVIE